MRPSEPSNSTKPRESEEPENLEGFVNAAQSQDFWTSPNPLEQKKAANPEKSGKSGKPEEPEKPWNTIQIQNDASAHSSKNSVSTVSPARQVSPVSTVSTVSTKPSDPVTSSASAKIASIPAGSALESGLDDEDLLQLLEIEEQNAVEGKAAVNAEVDQIFASMENEGTGENEGTRENEGTGENEGAGENEGTGEKEGGRKAVESSLREEQFRLSQEVSGQWSELSQLNNSVLQSVAPKGINQTLSLDDMEDLMSEYMKQFFM